jgi:hypothetical protein
VQEDLQGARERLSAFIVASAKDTAHEAGFGWSARLDAPDKYSVLREHYEQVLRVGGPLHVSSYNSGNVIFTSPAVNHAFRFWHDMHHVKLGLSFKFVDEIELALWHLAQVQVAGFSKGSLERRLLEIYTLGQNYLYSAARCHPSDQLRFVQRCLELGLHEGVLEEARRQQ